MADEAQVTSKPPARPRVTVVYGKAFALLGLIAGLGLVACTPIIVTVFHDVNNDWVESLPDWTVPTMLIVGMSGGILLALVSVLFAMLLPSRISPRDD